MRTPDRFMKLENFFQEVVKLTIEHEVIGDAAVVYPSALGVALSRVDPEWYRNRPSP